MHARDAAHSRPPLGYGRGGAILDLAQARLAALAIHQDHEARRSPANDRVTLAVAHTAAPLEDIGPLISALRAKALVLPRAAAAAASATLAPAQVLLQRASTLAISSDLLVDALDADSDCVRAGDPLRTPDLAQTLFGRRSDLRVDAG